MLCTCICPSRGHRHRSELYHSLPQHSAKPLTRAPQRDIVQPPYPLFPLGPRLFLISSRTQHPQPSSYFSCLHPYSRLWQPPCPSTALSPAHPGRALQSFAPSTAAGSWDAITRLAAAFVLPLDIASPSASCRPYSDLPSLFSSTLGRLKASQSPGARPPGALRLYDPQVSQNLGASWPPRL